MPDIINVEILEDGSLKMTTDAISMPNHLAAESFLKEVARLTDGKVNRQRRGHAHHTHGHHHGHTHDHTH